jgi:hypothetical protein
MKPKPSIIAAAIAGALSLVTAAPAAAHAQAPVHFSLAGGFAAPIGDLGDAADLGFNLSARAEGAISRPGWAIRGDLTWDHFGGKGPVDSYSYLGFAANMVHHESASVMYEFGGLGVYGRTVNYRSDNSASDTNLGLQFGLGFNLNTVEKNTFVEIGLSSIFTDGGTSLWIPIRLGVRF